MGQKPFWKSKTVWAVVLFTLHALYEELAQLGYFPPLPGWVETALIPFLAALGLYGRYKAETQLSL